MPGDIGAEPLAFPGAWLSLEQTPLPANVPCNTKCARSAASLGASSVQRLGLPTAASEAASKAFAAQAVPANELISRVNAPIMCSCRGVSCTVALWTACEPASARSSVPAGRGLVTSAWRPCTHWQIAQHVIC